jgi:hypothetical protein
MIGQGIKKALKIINEQAQFKSIHKQIDIQFERITDLVLQNAKSSSLPDCKILLDSLTSIYDIIHPENIKESYKECKEEDEYIPNEFSFRPILQWFFIQLSQILYKTKKNKLFKKELDKLILTLLTVFSLIILGKKTYPS